jgi:hypothetical protein
MKKNLNVYFKLLYKIFDECMRYKKCMDAKFFTQKVLLCFIYKFLSKIERNLFFLSLHILWKGFLMGKDWYFYKI